MPDLPKPGDHVRVVHDCRTDFPRGGGGLVRHDTPVLVTAVDHTLAGHRIRGIRCDATRIEWIHGTEEDTRA